MDSRKSRFKYPIFMILISLSFLSCTDIFVNKTAVTHENTLSLVRSPISKVEKTIATLVEPSSTETAEMQYQKVIRKCVEIVPQFEEKKPVGKLVFDGDYINFDGKVLNLANKGIVNIKNSGGFDISPNREAILYKDKKSDEIVILNSENKIIKKIPPIDHERINIHWLNNDEIIYDIYTGYNSETNSDAYLQVLDVKRGDRFTFKQNQFPGLETVWILKDLDTSTNMVLSPDKKYMIYPSEEDIFPYKLWNFQQKKSTLSVNPGRIVKWMSFVEGFLIIGAPFVENESKKYFILNDSLPYKFPGHDLFFVELEGKVKRLTFYSTKAVSFLSGLSLSIDESKLAFLLQRDDDIKLKRHILTVIDMDDNEITDYCFAIEGPIVWSPDGKYLMVSVKEEKHYSVYIVEVETGKAMKVAEHAIGKGWLK